MKIGFSNFLELLKAEREAIAKLVEQMADYLPDDNAQISSRSPKEMRRFLMEQLAAKIRSGNYD